MDIVGSRFRHVLRHHPGRASIFRIVIGGRYFHFLNRFLVGNDDLKTAETVSSVRDAVYLVFTVSEELPIDHRVVELGRIFAFPNLEKVLYHSGHQVVQF